MSSLRITAGTLRGRRIPVPRGDVRPTSERARQAYFNIVGDRIAGASFLDLFAGSGIFSFEAVSRGAASSTAIDRDTAGIAKQAEDLGVTNIQTIAGDALSALKRLPAERFDLVYADPPYDYDRYGDLLEAIEKIHLADEAIVAVEHRRRTDLFNRGPRSGDRGLKSLRRAEYGEVWITFFQAETATGIAMENE
ncbi:MAG TPA: RsmD family RNA methyltransferase [Thermoanaerobaculia bacterium]|nr:RsmD family RNA methyltransferase [Thermoanaerobaculia bacterium]